MSAKEKRRKKRPWEMTSAEVDAQIGDAISNGMHAYDDEPARFREGDGVEDVTDDSALEDLPTK